MAETLARAHLTREQRDEATTALRTREEEIATVRVEVSRRI